MSTDEQVQAHAERVWQDMLRQALAEWPSPPATRWAAVTTEAQRHLHNLRVRAVRVLQRPDHRPDDPQCTHHDSSRAATLARRRRGRADWLPGRYAGPACTPCMEQRVVMAHRRSWLEYARTGAHLSRRGDGAWVVRHDPPPWSPR